MFNPFESESRPMYEPPVALTIAGSDSGGGAGIQADLKTFAACKVFGTSVLTLVTAQNTKKVSALEVLPDALVRAQYEAVVSDFGVKAAKTGALGSNRMIGLVAELLEERRPKHLVVDPVMVSKHGDPLLPDDARKTFAQRMLPLADMVTPNRFEAEALSGRRVEGLQTMRDAAKAIVDRGARTVLLKGSHLDENVVRDIYYDGSGFLEFGADRVKSKALHGSGCVFSSAVTSMLARGASHEEALEFAREFISSAIALAPKLGNGISPVNPCHEVWNS